MSFFRNRNRTSSSFEAFDHLATMVAVLDREGRCEHVNAAFESTLGLPRRALQGSSAFGWFVDPAMLKVTFDAVVANEYSTARLEALLGRPPGAASSEPLPVHAIVTQIDHGEQVLLELVELEQQARQDREARALDQARITKELIRNLAHEIKNPLGGIRGAAQLLEHELGNPSLKEYTQVIIKEADRLQDLMQRLLTPHRPMLPATVNIHEILERVRSLLTAEFPGSLAVRRDYDTSLPELVGDREQLIQAVLNIARNAAQAMNGEGEIVLKTRSLRQVTLAKKRYRLAMEIKVIDNGPGIPDDIRERMFYPLVSGREGGSGLGLTIAQNFIQHHHGTIDCASRPGSTVFTLRLPIEQA